MPLLLSKKVCFIHIPKTGGTSIEQVLFQHAPNDFCLFWASNEFQKKLPLEIHPNPALHEAYMQKAKALEFPKQVSPQHYRFCDIEKLFPDLRSWFCFAFVRNPWERIYSEWKFATTITKKENLDFTAFINLVTERLKNNASANNNHYRPQTDFLSAHVRVYRYEDFPKSVPDVLSQIGISPSPIPHIYQTSEKNEYRKHYDSKLVNQVASLYAKDLQVFDYHF